MGSRILKSGIMLAAALSLGAQEAPEYFSPEAASPWRPDWSLRAVAEHFRLGDDDPPGSLDRSRGTLRLRWGFGEEGPLHFEAGLAGRLGSDGNRFNLDRLDNTRSNGAELDVADLRLRWMSPGAGLELHGGLLENPLVSSASLWDEELRIAGASARAFYRQADGPVQEAGIRTVAGRVRLLEGGRVGIRAAQAVLRMDTGPVAWTAHLGAWRLEARQEDAADFLRSNAAEGPKPGPYGYGWVWGPAAYKDPAYDFTVYGLGLESVEGIPFELKALRHENRRGGRGQELQAWLGSRTRAWWPQVGYVRQQLDWEGALASVNGDRWWFHSGADGGRYVLALNLPARWRVQADYVRQVRRDNPGPVTRSSFGIIKRF